MAGRACGAELHSAVSRSWTPRGLPPNPNLGRFQHLADCKSAIQQVENLRYDLAARGLVGKFVKHPSYGVTAR